MDPAAAPGEALRRYAAASLPRYTSYPTAPRFGPLGDGAYRGWLAGAGPAHALSLYVHVPFCRSLCWCCGCHTAVTRVAPRLARYAATLADEARLLAAALPPHGGPRRCTSAAARRASWARRRCAAWSACCAASPARARTPTSRPSPTRARSRRAVLEAFARYGFTRASLGVQDVSSEVQARIGRPQPAEQVAGARHPGAPR